MQQDSNFHHSMLVHCNVRTSNHEALEGFVREYLNHIRRSYVRPHIEGRITGQRYTRCSSKDGKMSSK